MSFLSVRISFRGLKNYIDLLHLGCCCCQTFRPLYFLFFFQVYVTVGNIPVNTVNIFRTQFALLSTNP